MTQPIETPELPDPIECEIHLLIDEEGGWTVCGHNDDEDDRCDEVCMTDVRRRIRITVTARPPVATEISVTVPDAAAGTVDNAVTEA